MMRKLTFPFRLATTEIKKDNVFRKTMQSKALKTTIFGFMGQSVTFLIIFSGMYYVLAYVTIVTVFFLEPVGLIAIPVAFLMLKFFMSLYKNLHPKVKKNFLKRENVYEKYLEVTKDIDLVYKDKI